MKTYFKYYLIGWVIALAAFNVVAIVTPNWPTLDKVTPSFIIGYVFVNVAFIGQLICGINTFNQKSLKKTFYNLPLFTISIGGLVLTLFAGIICMVISILPYFVAAILCLLILLVNVISIVKAKTAADLIEEIDEKIENQTAFIYEMRQSSDVLLKKTSNEEIRKLIKKVNDAFKYSDPVSCESLSEIEKDIYKEYESLNDLINQEDVYNINVKVNHLLDLINTRNNKCKLMK